LFVKGNSLLLVGLLSIGAPVSQVAAQAVEENLCVASLDPAAMPTARVLPLEIVQHGKVTGASARIGRKFVELWNVTADPLTPIEITVNSTDGFPRLVTPNANSTNLIVPMSHADEEFGIAMPAGLGNYAQISDFERRFANRYIMPPSGHLSILVTASVACRGLDYTLEAVPVRAKDSVDSTFVLLVGVPKTYASSAGVPALPGVPNDLQLMHTFLVQGAKIPEDHIAILGDRPENPATVWSFLSAFHAHLMRASGNGTAIIYFSGHGTSLGRNFDLSAGPDPESDGQDQAWVLADGWLVDDLVNVLLDKLAPKRRLVILDMCSAGDATLGGGRGDLVAKGVKFRDLLAAFGRRSSQVSQPVHQTAAIPHSNRTDQLPRIVLGASEKAGVAYASKSAVAPRASLFTASLTEVLTRQLTSDDRRSFRSVIVDDVAVSVLKESRREDLTQRVVVEGAQRNDSVGDYFRP